jgi:cell division protein FtsL
VKRRVRAAATHDARDRGRWLACGIVVYAVVAASGIGVAAQGQRVRDLFAELERTQAQQDELLSDYSRLLLERSTLASYQNVDLLAEQRLAMRFPELVERVKPEPAGRPVEGLVVEPTGGPTVGRAERLSP